MLKTLIKKQFLELNAFYFQDKKTGKIRSLKGIIGYIALMLLIFLTCGVAFYGMGTLFITSFVGTGLEWLYFSIMGFFALVAGVFGSVFNTYSGLYHAKDNELLLSMPVNPKYILASRMVNVYGSALLFESIVLIPAIICYWVYAENTLWTVIAQLLLVLILNFVILGITCALGWIVALISERLKNKSFVTVLLSLSFIALYYAFYFNLTPILQSIVTNADQISEIVYKNAYPVYAFGMAAVGDVVSFLLFLGIAIVILSLTLSIMSKTFIRILTSKRGSRKTAYVQNTENTKSSSVMSALVKRELKHFTYSATYMMNCGLGIVFIILGAVVILIKGNDLYATINELLITVGLNDILPVFVVAICVFLNSMGLISAPSVSLEGNTIWIVQSLPVKPMDILEAKIKTHTYLMIFPTILITVAMGYVFKLNLIMLADTVIVNILIMYLIACLGVLLNLKHPNLHWTSETVPVKQSVAILILMFGGFVFAGLFTVIYFLVSPFVSAVLYLVIWMIIVVFFIRLVKHWINTKGADIFAFLS